MQYQLTTAGYRQHRHDPPVEHLDTSCSHGCVHVAALTAT
jgi:hypothetical protein